MEGQLTVQSHVRSMIDTDGAVLLDLKAGKYYSLNTVGARIWSDIEKGLSVPEILRHLEETFPGPAERLQTDLTAFVQGLKDKELIDGHA